MSASNKIHDISNGSVVSSQVILHIYSISERINRFTLFFGLGLYHTAVEVFNQEHSFVGHPFHFSGIISTIPKTANYIYQESIHIGKTKLDQQAVSDCLRELGDLFTGNSYHLLHHNCNHFSKEFIQRLCSGKLPSYINRAANTICCLSFLDTVFSSKIDVEKFFVEVLYLTLNGDMNYVIDILNVDYQTNFLRYNSYIEVCLDNYSIPKCIPYYPISKTVHPFTPSKSIVELIKKNLCSNFIYTQSKIVYDLAFDLYEMLKAKNLLNRTLSNYKGMVMDEPNLISNTSSCADYSTDIHRYLNQIHQKLMETIGME